MSIVGGLDIHRIIFSSDFDHGFELRGYEEDGVLDAGSRVSFEHGPVIFGLFLFGVSRLCACPRILGGPAFAEGAAQCGAELFVFGFQAVDAVGGGFEPAQQRGAGCALPAGNYRGPRPLPAAVAEPLDLTAEIVLAVEPGSGDAGLACEAGEGN